MRTTCSGSSGWAPRPVEVEAVRPAPGSGAERRGRSILHARPHPGPNGAGGGNDRRNRNRLRAGRSVTGRDDGVDVRHGRHEYRTLMQRVKTQFCLHREPSPRLARSCRPASEVLTRVVPNPRSGRGISSPCRQPRSLTCGSGWQVQTPCGRINSVHASCRTVMRACVAANPGSASSRSGRRCRAPPGRGALRMPTELRVHGQANCSRMLHPAQIPMGPAT